MNRFQLSPSLTTPVLPRLQGDGMDSEKLRLSPSSSSQPQHRTRKNLQPQSLTKPTYYKQPHRATIPHEPVKGAVKAVEIPTEKTIKDGVKKHTVYIPTSASLPNLQQGTKAQLIPKVYSHASLKEECVVAIEEAGGPEEREEEEERSVEGSTDSHLVQQVSSLKEELDVQLKVNSDLKKLLVASVGDDLHHKVEAIVRTRAQLATDITHIDKQRKEEFEDLDHITIQADMWRSKYMASRVLVESLRHDKAQLREQKQQSVTALQQLMAERDQVSQDLIHTHRYVKMIRDAFDMRGLLNMAPVTVPNILELARTVLHAASAAKARLLPVAPILPAALDYGIVPLGSSPAERLAQQVLSGGESSPQQSATAAATAAARNFYRFHPSVRYDNITFDCCRKCKGDIHIV